jgi:hypothetical protein
MESPTKAGIESRVVFTSGSESFTVRELIDSARVRGELESIWNELLRLVAAEERADEKELELDDSAIDQAAEAFRYEYDLITAEETEQWLEERGLTLNDFTDYFVRHYWGNEVEDVEREEIDLESAPNELRDLLIVELILSGELGRMAKRSSWRVAGSHEVGKNGLDPEALAAEKERLFERTGLDENQLADWVQAMNRDRGWLGRTLEMEALYRQKSEALLNRKACEHEVAGLRLPLTQFDLETVELDSLDAAREALLCVHDDGMSMEEVATEGRYPYRRAEVLLEDLPEDLQQKFLSVSAGDILDPIARGDGFYICRVIEKAEPKADDDAVRERAEHSILERHFSELTAKHIQWRILSTAEQ